MKRSDRQKAWILVLVLVCVLGIILRKESTRQIPAETVMRNTEGAVSPSKEKTLTVYLTGAVRTPGVYEMHPGDRVSDLVDNAGGFLTDADRSAVNLAAVLKDGLHFHIPLQGEVEDGPVNINTASKDALSKISGIGPSKADAIVKYREENGLFGSVEELLQVSGIGQATLDKIRALVCV